MPAYSVEYVVMCPTWPHGKNSVGQELRASLTYANATGGTEQLGLVYLPWSMKFTAESGAFLYLSAQAQGISVRPSAAMDIRVQIKVNGVVVKEATSRGAFTIATVSGIL